MVYCFKRQLGGKKPWYNPVENQQMIVSQFDELPMVLFTARYQLGGGWTDRQRQRHEREKDGLHAVLPSNADAIERPLPFARPDGVRGHDHPRGFSSMRWPSGSRR